MTQVIQDTQSLLSLLLIICVLLLIMRLAAPTRGGRPEGKRGRYKYRARTSWRILGQYDIENHLLGPLVVALLLLVAVLGESPDLLGACVSVGIFLGIANRLDLLWKATVLVLALIGSVIQIVQAVLFIAEPHAAGLMAGLYKASVLILIWAFFSLGALFSVMWSRNLTYKALSFIVVLELVMVLAEPFFEVSFHMPPLWVITWVGVACAVAAGIGLMSFPITLDLLAVGLGLALWSSAVVDEPHLGTVVVGVFVGLFVRWVFGLALHWVAGR